MTEHYWTPQSNVSNETSTNKTFQRTISAQDTLAYATALLNEKEQSGSSNGSDGSPANDNAERSLRQVRPAIFDLRLIARHQQNGDAHMGHPQPAVLLPTAVSDRLKPPRASGCRGSESPMMLGDSKSDLEDVDP
ncbi:Ubiquitin carboxyl-terminal hydrolase 24 [Liparis tanakae]|uniref:Ubiquitin carboxyl-terminal hydrolase 24 n=1 Tax=Liparis tanakae TaxID=230148 RepID=A0A4Z2E598_9TELE|nr:Ubiquitin carboxyl-terminal hydrolase 24 [Liparis tanakae]